MCVRPSTVAREGRYVRGIVLYVFYNEVPSCYPLGQVSTGFLVRVFLWFLYRVHAIKVFQRGIYAGSVLPRFFYHLLSGRYASNVRGYPYVRPQYGCVFRGVVRAVNAYRRWCIRVHRFLYNVRYQRASGLAYRALANVYPLYPRRNNRA